MGLEFRVRVLGLGLGLRLKVWARVRMLGLRVKVGVRMIKSRENAVFSVVDCNVEGEKTKTRTKRMTQTRQIQDKE